MDKLPSFDQLPLNKNDPPLSAWGLYGHHDQLGTLNRLTGEVVVEAAKEIKTGIRISLNWGLDAQAKPGFGRPAFSHTIVSKPKRVVNDDVWVMNTQSSSQWDGLRHLAYQKTGQFYNGVTQEHIQRPGNPNSPRLAGVNGIHFWAERGIVGRGVLLDHVAWREHILRSEPDTELGRRLAAFDPFTTSTIELPDLLAIAAHQNNTTFHPADILIIRSGYIKAYQQKTPEELFTLNSRSPPQYAGLARGSAMLRFIWENFSAVAGDAPALEAYPMATGGTSGDDISLHEVLLSGWGCPIGELWDLEALSVECKRQGRYSFFLTSEPCNVTGAVASPPNALAIF